MQSESIAELATALAKAQGAMVNAKFDKENPHFKSGYASLAAIIDAIRAPLSANGLSYTQATGFNENGEFGLTTMLMHASGEWKTSDYPLPQSARPQEMGSNLTYARRYTLSALAGIAADEDDDANASEAKGQRVDAGKGPDYVKQGGEIIAALANCKTTAQVELFEKDNATIIGILADKAPRVAARVRERISDTWLKLNPKTAEMKENEFLADLDTEMKACKTRKGIEQVWENNRAAIDALPPELFDAAAKSYEAHSVRVPK